MMASMKSETLSSYLLIWILFISFCGLMTEARTSSAMLNNSGENGNPCCVPHIRGKALKFSLLRMILAVGLSYMAFMMLRYIPYIPIS